MRQIISFMLVLSACILIAQERPKFIQDKIEFCDASFSDELTTQLQKELIELENYFISKALLTDGSATSYRAVYERIAYENDLTFQLDTSFNILDTLSFELLTNCLYKLLTQDQLRQLNQRHQKAAERINSGYDGNITPSIVAERILDNLTLEDFKLEFYRISSLLTFYRISFPKSNLDLGLPEFSNSSNEDLVTIDIFLNQHNEIELDGRITTLEKAKEAIYKFISQSPQTRGVQFSAARSASYELYLDANEMIHSTYADLASEIGEIPKNIAFKEPK